ncbi:hypothetical protein CYMTET_54983, partial [Cymbomonas tetramitiformis]
DIPRGHNHGGLNVEKSIEKNGIDLSQTMIWCRAKKGDPKADGILAEVAAGETGGDVDEEEEEKQEDESSGDDVDEEEDGGEEVEEGK